MKLINLTRGISLSLSMAGVKILKYLPLVLLLICASLGCEKPPKQKNSQNVYAEYIRELTEVEGGLRDLEFSFDSEISNNLLKKADVGVELLELQLNSSPSLYDKLQQYLILSNQVIKILSEELIPDSNVYLVKRKNQIVSVYLGRIHADMESNNLLEVDKLKRNSSVDFVEFKIRFSRLSLLIRELKELDFPSGLEEKVVLAPLKVESKKRLQVAQKKYHQMYLDIIRFSELARLNANFSLEEVNTSVDAIKPLSGFYYSLYVYTEALVKEKEE